MNSIQKEAVLILHGIARSAKSMQSIAECIQRRGYDVLNLDYPSRKHSLEELTEIIHPHVGRFNLEKYRKLHFVTYSMGGLLARVFLNRYRPENLGRVVMLAPPNTGSEVADFWKDNRLYKKIYGPAGQQLTTDQTGIIPVLGERVDYELGIITGDRSIDPLHWFIIPGPNDGKVSVESTRLRGMTAHTVIHATHTFIMNNSEAHRLIVYFLENGSFPNAHENLN
jgi:triacylglycerol lipase